MADIRIEYHRLAVKEGREAKEWYAERSVRAAEKLEAGIRQALTEIQDDPARWPLNPDGTRFGELLTFPTSSSTDSWLLSLYASSRLPIPAGDPAIGLGASDPSFACEAQQRQCTTTIGP